MNNVDKPFSMACVEFKQELANLINNAGLPVIVIESILQNYLNEVSLLAKNQYQAEKIQYEKVLMTKANEVENEEEKED